MQFGSLSSINQDFQKRVNLHLSTASGCRKNWNTASISLDAHIAHSTLGLRVTFTITILKISATNLRHCRGRRRTVSRAWWRSPRRPSPPRTGSATRRRRMSGTRRGRSTWRGSPGWCSAARSSQSRRDTCRSYTGRAAST